MKGATNKPWRGYSFEELQDQILINEIRIHIQKKRLVRKTQPVKEVGKSGKNLVSTIMSFLDYADYLKVGFTIFRKIRGLFRRKKKKQK